MPTGLRSRSLFVMGASGAPLTPDDPSGLFCNTFVIGPRLTGTVVPKPFRS